MLNQFIGGAAHPAVVCHVVVGKDPLVPPFGNPAVVAARPSAIREHGYTVAPKARAGVTETVL